MLLFASASLLMLAQVGLDPSQGQIPTMPEELRHRPPRKPPQPASEEPPPRLAQCLRTAAADPRAGLESAKAWRATARAADRPLAAQCQGLALVGLERYGEAQAVFEAGRAEATGDARLRARLGDMAANASFAAGDTAAALAQADAALADAQAAGDNTLAAGIQNDRARALVALGRNEEAETALAAARHTDPNNADAWLLSATLSRRMNRLAKAQQQIERTATLAPHDPVVGLEAGVIAALSGREADARKSFQSVIDLAPSSEQAKQAHGYLEQLKP